MKKILIIIFWFNWLTLFSQDGAEPIVHPVRFYDTIKIDQPIIFQKGDTCEVFVMNNDSVCIVCNSLDTLRIDRGGTNNGSGTAITQDQINDSIETFGYSDDTLFVTTFSNVNDSIFMNRDITLFIDTANAFGHGATIVGRAYGTGDFNHTLTFASNANTFVLRHNQDSIFRSDGIGMLYMVLYIKDNLENMVYVTTDTFSYTPADLTAPLANSASIPSDNPDTLLIKTSENVQGTEGAGTGGFTITGYGSLTVTNVNISNDTIGLALSDSATADSIYIYSYDSGIGDISDGTNDLASFSDSSITNNIVNIPTDNLSVYYPFNGNANDESGNGFNGVEHNGVALTTDRDGNSNSAYSFDGINDWIETTGEITDFININTTSISLWLYPVGTSPTVSPSNLGDGTITNGGASIGIFRATVGGNDRIWALNYDGSSDQVGITYNTEEWIHIVLVHAGSAISIYKNGQFVNSVSSGSTSVGGVAAVYVGLGNGASYFEGKIDDIRIYTDELTTDEIEALSNE